MQLDLVLRLFGSDDLERLDENDLYEIVQAAADVERMQDTIAYRLVLSLLKDQYISAMTGKEGDSVDAMISIRAGLKNIDVIDQIVAQILYTSTEARAVIERRKTAHAA
ncbi:MAG: hypothetical protein ACR2RE_03590 [Geminicoccaceae bacterium]